MRRPGRWITAGKNAVLEVCIDVRYIKCDRETLVSKKVKSQLSQNLWQDLVTSVFIRGCCGFIGKFITLYWWCASESVIRWCPAEHCSTLTEVWANLYEKDAQTFNIFKLVWDENIKKIKKATSMCVKWSQTEEILKCNTFLCHMWERSRHLNKAITYIILFSPIYV